MGSRWQVSEKAVICTYKLMKFWHVMWRVGTSTFNCLAWTTGPPNNATHCGPLRSFRLFFWPQDDRTARVRVQPNSGILGPNRAGGMEGCNKNHQKHSKKHWSHTKIWDGFILDVNYHTMGPERSIPCLSSAALSGIVVRLVQTDEADPLYGITLVPAPQRNGHQRNFLWESVSCVQRTHGSLMQTGAEDAKCHDSWLMTVQK